MYLKSIRLDGFKSFADKTNIVLDNNITAIVGPNGSGKSNIVDAIRWVLGEQSVKNLRGTNQMTDVIFTGSKSRDGARCASVSLVFDNDNHYLNSDFAEIEVKRVLYKSGDSDYFINNSKVRLKDILDLFLDSGAGNDSFNIISQGAIETVINSKPNERRIIFEEAAGVLKYKKRKDESLKKLNQTEDNILKVNLIIDELNKTIEPLEEQSRNAKRYLALKDELKNIEISVIVQDITKINEDYKNIKGEIDLLSEKVLESDTNRLEKNSELERLKLTNIKIDEEISKTNATLLDVTNKYLNLQNEKQMYTERKKFAGDINNVNNNIVLLKEELLELEKTIKMLDNDIINLKTNINNYTKELNKTSEDEVKLKIKKTTLNSKIMQDEREILELKNKLEILENNINNDLKTPLAVRNIINNERLEGVHNTIGKLIEVPSEYSVAIETILGNATNFIVVDNEQRAKDCINFLKTNKLGRATFLPLNIIKGRYIEKNIYERVESIAGFIGVASDLISYNPKYDEIIKNQLGNVLIVKDMEVMNLIARILEYKYRIVTLDGEIMHAGGSLTGGIFKNEYGSLKDKKDLEIVKNTLADLEQEKLTLTEELNKILKDTEIVQDKEEELNRKVISLQEQLNEKLDSLNNKTQKRSNLNQELMGSEALKNNSIDNELMQLMENINKLETEKDITANNLERLKNEKNDLTSQIMLLEKDNQENSSNYNKLQNDLKQREIKLGKLDIKLDNLLLALNENYNMTYEKAKLEYVLDISDDVARLKVSSLKNDIASLGEVNVFAIEEYDRVKTRYDFLNKQKEDLELSSSNLKAIISEMDEVMITRFKETFEAISKEFKEVFTKLFKGGNGLLRLTDPDNILETGIDIIAEPPGKKLNSIGLLSGGEKTLTAISLLFAILNVKTVPFCILDEVEAALDEANVDGFGKYLQSKKNNSQFILITHKKRTMEYADTLYGITMQESGVSKVVSVKLENMQN